jgi:hypothetical protein
MNAPLADEYTNGEWSMTANPMSTEHGLPIRTQESFASSTTTLQPLSMLSGGLELTYESHRHVVLEFVLDWTLHEFQHPDERRDGRCGL